MSDNNPIDSADIGMESTHLSPVARRVVITVPARQAKRFHKKLKKSGMDSSTGAVQQRLAALCIETCIERFELKPIWGAVFAKDAPQPAFRLEQPFVITIDIDDSPEVEWPELSSLTFIRPVREITDAMVDGEMLEQRRNEGTRMELGADEALQAGDEIECSITVSAEGSEDPLYQQSQSSLRLPEADGTAVVFDIPAPDFSSQLIGRSIGAAFSITATAPETFFDPTLRGQEITLHITVNTAARIEPTTAEAIVEMYGSPSEAILRQQIRTALAGAVAADQESVLLTQVIDQLLAAADVPVPDLAIEMMIGNVSTNAAGQMKAKGASEADIQRRLEQDTDRIRQVATRLANRRSLIALLCKHLNVLTQEDELIAEIARLAAQQGRRPEDLRKELLANGQIQTVMQRVLERLAVSAVLEQAVVQDMSADEWINHQKAE
ncbi:MAG: hypothetical protein P8L37_06170 [Phycisphaerales bacterium]|nr:hypothetical protein [Phycisphaerales bacterium]